MSNIEDELTSALAGPSDEKKAVALHKTPKGRTVAEQDIYNAIKEQVLADLIKESKAATPSKEATKELVDFFVNLPVHAGMIRVDGREFYHGFTYKIDVRQRDSFAEIAGKAWAHDEEVRGTRKPFDSYRLTKGL